MTPIDTPRPPAERRASVRVEVDIAARIVAADGASFPCTIRNLSRSGVLVELHAAHIAALLPNVARDVPHLPVIVRLEFRLSGTESAGDVLIDCGIAHVRRIAEERGAMGLGFRRFHGGSEAVLATICVS
jgi:PilZ domain